jgi:hypothetical protein
MKKTSKLLWFVKQYAQKKATKKLIRNLAYVKVIFWSLMVLLNQTLFLIFVFEKMYHLKSISSIFNAVRPHKTRDQDPLRVFKGFLIINKAFYNFSYTSRCQPLSALLFTLWFITFATKHGQLINSFNKHKYKKKSVNR